MSEKDFLAQLKQHQRIIYKLVNIYARSDADKEDMQQEILLQAWRGYPSFRAESKFSTWLYRVSLNTIFTMKRRVNAVDYSDQIENLPVSVLPYESKENSERLYKAIRQLDDTEKAVISLHLEGYDNKEIAGMLGISANLTGVKIYRAKEKLAEKLKNI